MRTDLRTEELHDALLLDDSLLLALLVQPSPGLGPHELGGSLPLDEHRLALARGQQDRLPVLSDEADSVAGVDAVLADGAELGLDHHRGDRSGPAS